MKKILAGLITLITVFFLILSALPSAAADELICTITSSFESSEYGDSVSVFVMQEGKTLEDLDSVTGDIMGVVAYIDNVTVDETGYFTSVIPVSRDILDNECVITCNGVRKRGTLEDFVTSTVEQTYLCIAGFVEDKETQTEVEVIILKSGHTYAEYAAGDTSVAVSKEAQSTDARGGYAVYFTVSPGEEKGNVAIKCGDSVEERAIASSDIIKKIYVSADAAQSGDGSYDNPYKTFDEAQAAAKSNTQSGYSVDVCFFGGEYTKSPRMEISETNTGDTRARYIAVEGEEVIFTGMKKIDSSLISLVTDKTTLAKFPERAQGSVYQISLADAGVSENYRKFFYDETGKSVKTMGLYLNGKRQELSRYPNEGYSRAESSGKDEEAFPFIVTDEKHATWSNTENAFVAGLLREEWEVKYTKIKSISNDQSTITLDAADYTLLQNPCWFIANLPEEMDIPGEWCTDFQTGMLYYYAPHPLTENDVLEIPGLTRVLWIRNDRNIILENIEIKGAAEEQCVYITGTENVEIRSCTIHSSGSSGISSDGKNTLIDSCNVYDTGSSGIVVSGGHVKETLTPGNNAVTNNHVYSYNNYPSTASGQLGISIGKGNFASVGDVAKNNLIHGSEYAGGIIYGGLDTTVSRNEIYNVLDSVGDAGCIYSGRRWNEYGAEVNENYIHDFYSLPEADGLPNRAIYWDDFESGQTAQRNIIVANNKINTVGVYSVGKDNLFQNNVMVSMRYGLSLGNRNNQTLNFNGEEYPYRSLTLGTNEAMLEKYSEISTLWAEVDAGPTQFPSNAVARYNVAVDVGNAFNAGSGPATREYNYKGESGIFVNPDIQDYRIKTTAVNSFTGAENVPTDTNFDMELVGVQTEVPMHNNEFALLYPNNNAQLNADEVVIAWEEATFSDRYDYVVARDSAFTEVVASGSTKNTFACLDALNNGTYYWKVTAVNTSRDMGQTWGSENGTFSFSVTAKSPLVLSNAAVYSGETALESLEEAAQFDLKMTVSNKSSSALSYVAVVAVYDGNGSIKEVTTFEDAADAFSGEIQKSYSVALKENGKADYYVRCFVLENFSTIKPLGKYSDVLSR